MGSSALSDYTSNVTPTTPTISTDSTLSYRVTLNDFSSSVETYNGIVNSTTALGPIGFD